MHAWDEGHPSASTVLIMVEGVQASEHCKHKCTCRSKASGALCAADCSVSLILSHLLDCEDRGRLKSTDQIAEGKGREPLQQRVC